LFEPGHAIATLPQSFLTPGLLRRGPTAVQPRSRSEPFIIGDHFGLSLFAGNDLALGQAKIWNRAKPHRARKLQRLHFFFVCCWWRRRWPFIGQPFMVIS
jgi:hypothetical protein